MTTLYFLRHAEAHPQQPGHTDAERALTARGREQCEIVAKFLKHHRITPNHVWASPYLRTQQSARILIDSFKHSNTLHSAGWLALGENPQNALNELNKLSEKHELLFLVSHEPNISELIIALLGANPRSLQIKKASLTAITLDLQWSGRGQLLWSLPPTLMLS